MPAQACEILAAALQRQPRRGILPMVAGMVAGDMELVAAVRSALAVMREGGDASALLTNIEADARARLQQCERAFTASEERAAAVRLIQAAPQQEANSTWLYLATLATFLP